MSLKIIDLADVLERVQGDKKLLLELLDIFVEDYQKKIKLLEKSVSDNDYGQAHSLAHSLKGASGNIGAKAIYETFFQLDQMAKNNDLSQAADILAEMTQCFKNLKERIAALKKEFKEQLS